MSYHGENLILRFQVNRFWNKKRLIILCSRSSLMWWSTCYSPVSQHSAGCHVSSSRSRHAARRLSTSEHQRSNFKGGMCVAEPKLVLLIVVNDCGHSSRKTKFKLGLGQVLVFFGFAANQTDHWREWLHSGYLIS